MAFDVRFIETHERPGFRALVYEAFGDDVGDDKALAERWEATIENRYSIGSFDRQQIVGTLSSFDFDLTIPGGQVPMAGTTIVAVRPTHRRQGLLKRMMRMHLEQARELEKPCAGLWATQWPIYGRFGYGACAVMNEVEFDTRRMSVAGPEPGVSVRRISPEDAQELAPAIFDAVRSATPGMTSRSETWWKYRVFHDHPVSRHGMTALRWVSVEVAGDLVGYAAYRQKLDWDAAGGNGKVRIEEMLSVDERAHRALWHYFSSIDLYPRVQHWNAPTDDPLRWLVSDPRLLKYTSNESLWLRILDLPEMLQRRRYVNDVSISIRVVDPIFADLSGSYSVTVSDGAATVETVPGETDITIGMSELGAIYFGQTRARSLHAAGLIRGPLESVATLDQLVAWPASPWAQEIF